LKSVNNGIQQQHRSHAMRMQTFAPHHQFTRAFAIVIGSMLWLASSVAAASALNNLQFASLPGGQVEITLSFDDVPPQTKGYTIETPARIVLDLLGADSKLDTKYHNLGVGNARSVTVMETPDRTRLIINLTELVGYTTEAEGNDLVLTVGRSEQEQVMAQAENSERGATMKGIDKEEATAQGSLIQEIDFRRGVDGDGQLIVQLSDPNVSVDMSEEAGKIVVAFMGVDLPEELQRRLDVIDFATPVQIIDATVEDGNAVMHIKPTGYYEYLAYQADQTFTISVKPVTEQELEARNKDNFLFTGEKLSLNFQDIEVRSVLQLIADFTGLNLVASDTVSGRITLRLKNVPWDQALDLILKTKGLDKRKVGNVMLVAPADEIAARERLELETTKQVEELAPIRTEFIQVNYAKATDIAGLISGADGAGMLSSRGSVTVDERTNTLLVQDTANKIEDVRRVLSRLDVPVKQVLIEARVVVANTNFDKELGVRWGGYGYNVDRGLTDLTGDGEANVFDANRYVGGSTDTVYDQWSSRDLDDLDITRPNDLVVDLGVNNSEATSFAIGFFTESTGLLILELSALEADGQADIVATPKVLTADQQPARIASGTEIPYQEASSSGATSVSFKEAVLSLDVTPQITPDGRIIMELQVNQDTVGEIFNNVPSIDTNSIETRVLVSDGETIVLGGVFRNESINRIVKTPFFGDLPIIGRLFKKTVNADQKQELLVFITPKIVKGALAQQ
jgi:type IV pilus assembly protein PilQ